MNIEQQLLTKKKIFFSKWFDLLANSYPAETVRLLKKESNQFANPVGHTFSAALGEILDEFLGENSAEKMAPLLDRIIRIRAVQDFSPSSSLAFIFGLKMLAREVLKVELAEGHISQNEILEFDAKVDGLALFAFDVYSRCREQLFDVRIREVKDRTHRLLKRAQIIADVPPEEPQD
jgi:hypothetical protein